MYSRHLTQVGIVLAVIFKEVERGVYLVGIASEGKIWCQTSSCHQTVSCAILSDSLCQSCLEGVSAAGRRDLSGGDFSLKMTHLVAAQPVLDGGH